MHFYQEAWTEKGKKHENAIKMYRKVTERHRDCVMMKLLCYIIVNLILKLMCLIKNIVVMW